MEKIIHDMKLLGMNEYEIRAYITLLKEYPVNGYTLSKKSGIPRSRIYEVLENLKNKQIVFEEIDEKSSLYTPLEPEMLVEKFKVNITQALKNIEKYTTNIYNKEKEEEKLVIVSGIDKIIEFSNLLISKAKKKIAISIWEEEIIELKDNIDAAIERGVSLKGIYFGDNNPFKELVVHRRRKRYLSEKKVRNIIISIDGSEILSGVVSRGEASKVTITMDKGFVSMGEDYIEHDLMINLFGYSLHGLERVNYENFLDEVRKDYTELSDEEFEKLID